MTVDWVPGFYSNTARWWGDVDAEISERDVERMNVAQLLGVPRGARLLELECGYGATARLMAEAGYEVVAIDLSDRIDLARRFALPETLTLVKDNFYTAQLDGAFDAVCYWDGFGVGSDDDQHRLLRRIATEWLHRGGVALIDVYNPFVWAGWDGMQERRSARPEIGYRYNLGHTRTFDGLGCRATDTWWDEAAPTIRHTQSLRCYAPADLQLLLRGTGLTLRNLVVNGSPVQIGMDVNPGAELLAEAWSYLAALETSPRAT